MTSLGNLDCPSKPHVVYYAFDANDWPLYIGSTCVLTTRLNAHKGTWWYRKHLAYIATSEPMPFLLARQVETDAIREMGPAFNVLDNFALTLVREEENAVWWWERYGCNMHSRILRERLSYELRCQDKDGYTNLLVERIADELDRRADDYALYEWRCSPDFVEPLGVSA